MEMWTRLMVLGYLAVLGVKDWKEREIPLWWLLTGGAVLTGIGVYRCYLGELAVLEMLLGGALGALLLAVAWLTGKAGYGDGLVLMQLGVCLGYRESMLLFAFGLLLLSVVSIVLLFLRKVTKNTKMPYLPFLAIVCLLWQL